MKLILTSLLLLSSIAFAKNPTEEGPKIIGEVFGQLSAALAEAIAKGGPAAALSVCNEKAPKIAAEVSAVYGVKIRRATEKPRNPTNTADDAEQTILTVFAEALAKKEVPKPQTITHADGSQSFFAPIVLGNPLCLQCHGQIGKDIAPETLTAIQKLYPEDKATGFKLGDLRGLWHITFPTTH